MIGRRSGWPLRIVFWQPIVSPHQCDFLEAVARASGGEVILAAEAGLPAERVAQGWPEVAHERVRVVDANDGAEFDALVAHDTPHTLHVFSGFFSHPIVWRAFHRLASTRTRMAMLTEAPERRFPTGVIKRLRGAFLVRRHGARFEFAMAMGAMGRRFLEGVGFPREKIVTFGYRLRVPEQPWPEAPPLTPGPVRFMAAGQLIRRKGFDVLLEACGMLPGEGWTCALFGDGRLRGSLSRLAERCSSTGAIRIGPTLPNADLRRQIAASDWCVVPSRHDGWGMVVNEALIAGTPVICSDGCGAADLVSEVTAGQVVPAGDPAALAGVMRKCIAAGRIDAVRRSMVHAVAFRHGVDELVERFLSRLEGPC